MRLLQVAVGLGIAIAVAVLLLGFVDAVDSFLIGSGVTGAAYLIGTQLRRGPTASMWQNADVPKEADD